jgi:hypothetical protein
MRDDEPGRLLDRFDLLLVVVLAALAAQSLIDVRDSEVGRSVTHAISGAALLVAVRTAGIRRRWRRAADVLVLVVLVANALLLLLIAVGGDTDTVQIGPEVPWLIATVLVPVVVARRLMQHVEVGRQTVMGAVAAYLQIAIAYAFAFQSLDAITGRPFFGEVVPTTTYSYVSLETLTTLGYGDFTPAFAVGRLLAVSEAVVGQVYLVTFVALIVSRFASVHPPQAGANRSRTDDHGSG